MNKMNILFMGDSITQGQYIDPKLRWTSLIEKEIRLKYRDTLNLTFLNKGISGNTTLQALARYPTDVQNNSPDIITIQFGLNDCNYWKTDNGLPRVSPNAFNANLCEMIDRAFKSGAKKVILLNNHITLRNSEILSGGKVFEESRKEYNDIIFKVAEQKKVIFCDIDSIFNNLKNEELEELLLPFPDHLHLSEKGHVHYISKVQPIIENCINLLTSESSKSPKDDHGIVFEGKSNTDIFWNSRPFEENEHEKVNISDLVQRRLETNFLLEHLSKTDKVLEVGCGNGFLTQEIRKYVAHVDGFDFAENMISQAKELYHEKNNKFFHDNVLDMQHTDTQYDVIICVRVLINLRDFKEQTIALNNMLNVLNPNGKIILIEGYKEGFESINNVRNEIGIESLNPASINYYSNLSQMLPLIEQKCNIIDRFHTGCFDFLTRVVYPALVGHENAQGPSDFHRDIQPIAQNYNLDTFKELSRLHGFVLKKNNNSNNI